MVAKKKKDIFERHRGRLTLRQIEQYLLRVPLFATEREYVERVMEKFDTPYSRWITKEEFLKGLEEMARNPKDPLSKEEVERIKKYFLEKL